MNNFFKNKNDIIKWLNKLSINEFTIHEDLTVDVRDDIFLSHHLDTLEFFPVQFGIIDGSFDCNFLSLSSLKGSPYEVKGDFNCSSNRLKTLEHAPLIVKGDFSCSYNSLVSLKGSPKNIGGTFACNENQLTSLEYAPEKVGGDFLCGDNLLLNLKGCPEEIHGHLSCPNNKITTFEGFPKFIHDMLNIRKNPIKTNELAMFTTHVSGHIYHDFGETTKDFFNILEMVKVPHEYKELNNLLATGNNQQNIIKRRI